MPRYSTLSPHLSVSDLEQRYRTARDPVERSHWHMLWLVACGQRLPVVARLIGYSANWVREIVRRYNADGAEGTGDRRLTNPSQRPLLTPVLREDLRVALTAPPTDGGLWTGPKVAMWMSEHLDRPVSPQRGWEALRALGFTPQRPRPRATHADPAAQAAFKKGAPSRSRDGDRGLSRCHDHGLGRR